MIRVEFKGQYGKVEYQTSFSAAADVCAQPPSTEQQAHQSAWRCGHTPGRYVLEPQDWCVIPTGLFIVSADTIHFPVQENSEDKPKTTIEFVPYLEITPRSGLAFRNAISSPNSPSIIDADYRNEIGVIVQNLGFQPFIINLGDRIAQIKCCYTSRIIGINAIDKERGLNGFGSTGV